MARERVQVQGIGGAVPGISPTIQRGGQYSVQVQQAGRNKLMDLADALSQVNPLLQQYVRLGGIQEAIGAEEAAALPESELFKTRRGSGGGRGLDPFAERAKERRFREEIEKRKVEYRKKLLAEGQQAFQLDPTGVSEQLKQRARKLAEMGELPDEANVIREVGALRAQAEVLAKRDYRAMLLDPTVLQTTEDPVVTALQKREEFLERIELQNPLVRDHALKFLMEAEDEFIDKAQDRLDARNIEIGKNSWLDLGRDSISLAIGGELDVNDEAVKTWLNHPAGIFKGSRKFAWDNLIKEDLKEGMTSGKYTPTQVTDFLDDLRGLDLGGGVKFADEETGNAISDFYGYVEGQRAVIENRAKEAVNLEVRQAIGSASQRFFEEYKESGTVSEDTYIAEQQIASEKVPLHMVTQVQADINQAWKMFEKRRDEATNVVFDDLNGGIEDGVDLDIVKADIIAAANSGSITADQYDKLNTRLENSRDFDVQVLKNPSYIDLKSSYNEIITGFKREKTLQSGLIDPSTSKGYFQLLTLDGNQKSELETDTFSVYAAIKNKAGEAKAKMFVNSRYREFDRRLRNTLENEFNKRVAKGESVDVAKTYIEENQDAIAEKLFESWSADSISVANTIYLK